MEPARRFDPRRRRRPDEIRLPAAPSRAAAGRCGAARRAQWLSSEYVRAVKLTALGADKQAHGVPLDGRGRSRSRGTVDAAHILDGHGRPWRPPPDQLFRPSVPTVARGSIAGIRIGEPIGTVIADVGTPTFLNAAVPALVGPVEQRADWDGAGVYYDEAARTVTRVDVLFSTGIRTSRGDGLGAPKSIVHAHYRDAVPYQSTCASHDENLLLRTPNPNYVLDLWFTRHRLQGAALVSWPKFTEICWLIHERRPVPIPLP